MTELEIEKENKAIAQEYKELLRISYQTLTPTDKKLIRKAFDVAVDAHKDQRRKSGEAYIFHPIAVAKIVASEIGLGATSIAAALLHEIVEDTPITVHDIEKLFNPKVAQLVEGLTKISLVQKDLNASIQAENFRKMILTLNDDVRVILIKLADRLHNMQTMDSMREDKQTKIASETLYIYAPLATLLKLTSNKAKIPGVAAAEAMGITLLNESEYRYLQQLGPFDTKTSSWLLTPAPIRALGGALFGDYRYKTVFVYHNGASSYYAARGFRGVLKV